ncbi:hypothetical protein U1839_10315 [Sphingomonas sp. RT2P30]|uniref:hypothetical protein n=1 Tax=Parasphingomonas halimpatiens TaxID=3096162 RepID=UPI002FC79354
MIASLSQGYGVEALIAALAGLWLIATGGSDGADKFMARRAPGPGSGATGYFKKVAAIDAGHKKRLRWPWRLAGLIMVAGAAFYLLLRSPA